MAINDARTCDKCKLGQCLLPIGHPGNCVISIKEFLPDICSKNEECIRFDGHEGSCRRYVG